MPKNDNSQEQTIYRTLAGKIQMGFYDQERFPSAKAIADQFQVSYCPAQRALKMLENNGLVKLCRGRATVVLAKPYENYLKTDIFRQRAEALLDLCASLKLISPAICFHSIRHMEIDFSMSSRFQGELPSNGIRDLYQKFEQSLHALGSRTALNLYYDIGAFAESAFVDILFNQYGKAGAISFFQEIKKEYLTYIQQYTEKTSNRSMRPLELLCQRFFEKIEAYLHVFESTSNNLSPETFSWEPHKGRTRYCDVIAIDLVCKINQNVYPVSTLLPNGSILANIYHVSEITIRRTMALLNKLGVAKTVNGVGTRVISKGDSTIPRKLKELTLDDNMRTFLEALQLLAIIGGPVMRYTFPHIHQSFFKEIIHAASQSGEKRAMVDVVSAGLQAVVNCCPLAAIREIYSKITLQLLNGSVLRLEETGTEPVPGWVRIADPLLESCRSSNQDRFASAYQQLFEQNFNSTKQTLIELGVDGADGLTGF